MATLTLRPNAAGNLNESWAWDGSAQAPSTNNYTYVDEADPHDAGSTQLYEGTSTWTDNLFGIPNHTTETGTINSVTIYGECSADWANNDDVRFDLRTQATNYLGTTQSITTTHATFSQYNQSWATNPNTSVAWTWTDIDNLEIGFGLRDPNNLTNYSHCTQNWVVIDYTPTTFIPKATMF